MKALGHSMELVCRFALFMALLGMMFKHHAEERRAVRQKAVRKA